MRKIYIPILSSLFIVSCGTQVNYIGTHYPPTSKVDVFVTQASVRKPFEVIGKGYVQQLPLGSRSVEVIQRKAVEKARLNGADAVIIEDYYVLDNTASITSKLDSTKLRPTQVSNINPAVASGFNIIFLKYKD